jgi:hypothetical protein
MFLYLFSDGTIRQVEDNPTVLDLVALSGKLLRIIRGGEAGYYELIKDESKLIWVPIRYGESKMCSEGKING